MTAQRITEAAAAMFGDAPYVVVEIYKDGECSPLSGVQAFSSDQECHVAIDGTRFTSTLADTGDGDVVLYTDDKCGATGDDKTTMALSPKMLGDRNPCTDSAKYYSFNGPPHLPNLPPPPRRPHPHLPRRRGPQRLQAPRHLQLRRRLPPRAQDLELRMRHHSSRH